MRPNKVDHLGVLIIVPSGGGGSAGFSPNTVCPGHLLPGLTCSYAEVHGVREGGLLEGSRKGVKGRIEGGLGWTRGGLRVLDGRHLLSCFHHVWHQSEGG